MDERRQFLRILFDRPAYLNHAEQAWSTTLLDLSLQGALVSTPKDWDSEITQFTLSFSLSDVAEQAIEIMMDVQLRHQNAQSLGLKITHIDIDSASHLKRLVALNLGDEELLHRELEHLSEPRP